MGAYIGDAAVTGIYLGDTMVSAAYLGDVKIWPDDIDMDYYDGFGRSDGSLGSDWLTFGNAPVIYDNAARAADSNNADGGALWHEEYPSDAIRVEVTVAALPDHVQKSGIIICANDNGSSEPTDSIYVEFGQDDWRIGTRTGGTNHEYATGTWTLGVGDRLALSTAGGNVAFRRNDAIVDKRQPDNMPPTGAGNRYAGFTARNYYQFLQPLYYSPHIGDWQAIDP